MNVVEQCKKMILKGGQIDKGKAMELYEAPLEALCTAANELRIYFCDHTFDLCTIVNGKSGRCSEDCRYCAQSSFYKTDIESYSLMNSKELVRRAKYHDEKGVQRYSIVTSGRLLSKGEIEDVCESIQQIKQKSQISVCVSMGLLEEEDFLRLKHAGVSRVHNNLETSRRFFPQVCTTHHFKDKVIAVKRAKKAGLEVCSGGIIGMGETREDRIDLVLSIKELGVKSIPVNILNPIQGTPFEGIRPISHEEVLRTIAVFRFLIPDGYIRMAGGRGLLKDKGRTCFLSGANAAITGDMLTTSGISIDMDKSMLQELGYHIGK